MISVFCDGGSRGNPGPAAVGVVACRGEVLLFEISEAIGLATNNIAEYTAVVKALEKLKEIGETSGINFTLDSELVVKQINGQYKVKDSNLKLMYGRISSLLKDFENVTFVHTKRHNNIHADKLVNKALDAK